MLSFLMPAEVRRNFMMPLAFRFHGNRSGFSSPPRERLKQNDPRTSRRRFSRRESYALAVGPALAFCSHNLTAHVGPLIERAEADRLFWAHVRESAPMGFTKESGKA